MYYYAIMVVPSKAAFILIFTEMAIFITYYKDVVFSFITLTNFCGMYYNSYKKLDDSDKHWFWDSHKDRDTDHPYSAASMDHPLLKSGGEVTQTFNSPSIIHNWLIGMVLLNLLWIIVTLVTDW